jgi:hypothetical protein
MRITVFAHNGGHHIGYTIQSLHSPWIIQDARPIIVDPPLTLIISRWYRYCLHYFAETDSQYNHYVTILKSYPGIIHVTSLKMIDAPLTIIFMMPQRVCRIPFWLNRRLIVFLWRCGMLQHL